LRVNFGGYDVGIRKVGAVFEAFVFEQKMSRLELESPASPAAALRVALTIIHGEE
jgi:hypothetical protein